MPDSHDPLAIPVLFGVALFIVGSILHWRYAPTAEVTVAAPVACAKLERSDTCSRPPRSPRDERELKGAAKVVLGLSEAMMDRQVAAGKFEEVMCDDQAPT